MQIKQLLEKTAYTFESGGRYGWNCYGNAAVFFDFKELLTDFSEVARPVGGAIVDIETGNVYEVTVEVSDEELCYRWRDPKFASALDLETVARGEDCEIAWDDIKYTDIEVEQDFLEKFDAIIHRRSFDRRIVVPINLTDEEELLMHRLAHEAGMSTNDFVVQLLEREVARVQSMSKKELKKERKRAKRGQQHNSTAD
jgi:predicted HTH domain antitoxin